MKSLLLADLSTPLEMTLNKSKNQIKIYVFAKIYTENKRIYFLNSA